MWNASRSEHFAREVHVREALTDDECNAIEDLACGRDVIANPPREFDDLLFAVASHNEGGRGRGAGSRGQVPASGLRTNFFDSGQPLMNPLMKRPRQRRVGHHDIDALQARKARKKVPVSGIQPVPIRGAIANGDNDVAPLAIAVCLEQAFADDMLVNVPRLSAASFEFAESRGEEPGLANQPFRPSILFVAGVQPSEREAFEVVHGSLVPLQRIEEFEHGADQSRTDTKWRFRTPFDRNPTRNGQEGLPFLDGERARVLRGPLEQPSVQLGSRHHVRKHYRGGLAQPIFNQPQQVVRCRARRHDDQAVAGVEWRPFGRKRREGASKRPEIRRPHESSRAGCDH
jgi:hypothetical protein